MVDIVVINKEIFKEDYVEKLQTMFAEDAVDASLLHQYFALGALIKDYCSKPWIESNKEYGTETPTHKCMGFLSTK